MSKPGFHFDTTYMQLPALMYHEQEPTKAPAPHLVLLNKALAQELGLDFGEMDEAELAALFSGNTMPAGATPLAQAYAGHQFGYFNMLGDGRAILWGEHLTPTGERVDLQFKGSGRTPFSRGGDGLAAIGPMLREYIISEAMHALGVPTTRSLAVVTTGKQIRRRGFLPGAILTRVASSHIRVGTFEYTAGHRDPALVKTLLTYTIDRHYPALKDADNPALALLRAVMEKQAALIADWMRVGFIHGVMNTDNMLLSGETVDYGPCAFMDTYDPATVFSSIDHGGRYAYGNQPFIAQWNLARLLETILPLIHEEQEEALALAQETIGEFRPLFDQKWLSMMRNKLGLFGAEDEDQELVDDLLAWMQQQELDYTNTFVDLSTEQAPEGDVYQEADFQAWSKRWQSRRQRHLEEGQTSLALMRANNPLVIPRNHKVEQALDAASDEGDLQPCLALLEALARPYEARPELEAFQEPPAPSERVLQTFCGT